MYEPFFEFRKRPFATVPCVDRYFPGQAIEAARTTLVRCIRRAEGPGLVIGPAGTGKTLLCYTLAEELADQLRVVLLAGGRLGSRRALLQAILYELGQPYRGLDEGEARLALADYITLSDECSNGILLLVDEAHTLPLRLLDEVRMTTNLAHRGKPWTRVVLAGGCVLEERFASPKLDSFNQRVAARCYLESLGAEETRQYIWSQTSLAGGRGESLFPEPACKAVYRATDGVPRLINQVCDHALLLACAAGHRQITAEHIEEAWADLQQLPTPWNGESARSPDPGDIIEFGRLDDEAEPPGDEVKETHDTVPALRISAGPDEGTETEPDMERQVDQIEHMLDRVDSEEDGFQPAGSIGPEIELSFDEPHNPFGDLFAEEEIVDDWPSTFGQSKSSDSATERESSILPNVPAAGRASEPGATMAHGETAVGQMEAETAIQQDRLAPEALDGGDMPATRRGPASEPADDSIPVTANAVEQGMARNEEYRHVERRRFPHGDDKESLFCVETSSEPELLTSACRLAPVPHLKYSRLFASLRRA